MPAASTSASRDRASDSDSTERSHIVTGEVNENATTAPAAGQRARPGTTVATDTASAAQHAVASTSCQWT